MTARRGWGFWAGFSLVILLIACGVSYLASSSPDGLEATTLRGCHFVEQSDTESLAGECIAQHAGQHRLAASPLADYSLRGNGESVGIAGAIGVAVTVVVAGAVFWLIARSRPRSARGSTPGR